MRDFDFINEIKDIFPHKNDKIRGSQLEPNRLAFLAATSKFEFVIRDEIAYRLHNKFMKQDGGYIVAREWKRYDLAILDNSRDVICLVEFKAGSIASAIERHSLNTEKDIRKLLRSRNRKISSAQKYVVLILMLPQNKFNANLKGVVKYLPGINHQFKISNPIEENYYDKWKAHLEKIKIGKTDYNPPFRIDAGIYNGVNIYLDLYIAGPLKPMK
jgi:hypothetical protein